MPEQEELALPSELEEAHSTATVDEDDLESEEEQTWEDEYSDTEGESTAPSHRGHGSRVDRFRCKACGHVIERKITGTPYDDLPPVHHNQYMTQVGEEESKLPFEEFLERMKVKENKKEAAKKAKASKAGGRQKPAKKAKPKTAKPAAKKKKPTKRR